MQQRTLIALATLAVIAVAAFFTLRAPEKGERKGPKPRPVPALKAADIKELEMSSNNGKDHVTMKLDGTTWKITSPGNWNADQSMVKTATEQLEKMVFGDIVTKSDAKYSDLEVSEDKGAHVIAKDGGGKTLLDAWLGKAASGYTMFRPHGKYDVWQVTGVFKYAFARDAATWRDHTILEFTKEDVSKLSVEAGGQRLSLEKIPPADKNTDAKWKVLESTVKVDPLDDGAANNLVQAMGTLRAGSFADAVRPADAGLVPPQSTITVVVKGKPITLLVGKAAGEDTYVRVDGSPQIYLVQKYNAERVAQAPINFRDKTLVKAKADDIVSIDVSSAGESWSLKHEGAAWKLAKGGEVDDAKVKALLSAFDNLQGSGFVVGVPAAQLGMDKPTGTVTLHLRDKSTVALKLGALTKDSQDYYLIKAGTPETMTIKKWSVDRFLKKSSELAKSATPATPPMRPIHDQ